MTNLSVNDDDKQLLLLSSCVESGDLAGIGRLLSEGVDPSHSDALSRAAYKGYSECVKLLIPLSDPKRDNSYALCMAAGSGHAECVKILIPVSDPKSDDSNALRWSARNGHIDSFRLLLPVSAPLIEMEGILDEALEPGHANVLSAMLAHEPRLLALMDLPASLADAVAEGHLDLQSLLRSIIDQLAIDTHLAPGRPSQKPSRL